MRRLSLNSTFQRTFLYLVVALILFNGICVIVSPEFSLNALFRYIVSRGPDAEKTAAAPCPKMSIQPALYPRLSDESLACRPHIQSEKACAYTARAYASHPSLRDCPELPYELCTVSEKVPARGNYTYASLTISCDMSLCDLEKPMFIEMMNPSDGRMTRASIPMGANDSTVERYVLEYAEKARTADLNFLYLNCTGLYTRAKISQLLTFLPALPRSVKETRKERVNVNVVLIDSLSRAHFYRSLPKTVEFLRKKNVDPDFPAHVFEYELFQAVHGHTHQSEHALFSGSLYPHAWNSKQRAATPVGLQILYGVFKDAGFQTMFLDDLCWKAVYGIVTKVKSYSWRSLLSKMKTTNIDTRGITEASCKLLAEKGKHDLPFFDNKQHQLCFNGHHQHEYLFDYLTRYIDITRSPGSKPLFSYTSTHVSHDEVGLRVQSVDKHLKDFINTLSRKKNTISFLFADHGNTYTPYQVKFLEGRQEMYHPMMVVVLPKKLARKFGRNIVRNLTTNQHRLFNMFDFRASLVALANYDGKSELDPAGLFGHISRHRTCRDVAMTEAAICLCRTRKTVELDPADEFILSEFAVGELNNKIQRALSKSRISLRNSTAGLPVLFGACQRLRIRKVTNIVQESQPEGLLATSMDLTVQSGTIVDQVELITVRVQSTARRDAQSQSHLKMKLLSFNRISQYGSHKMCADQGVPLSLCVCDKISASAEPKSTKEILGVNSSITSHPSLSCLLQIRRELSINSTTTPEVGVFEMANICRDRTVNVTISAKNNIRTSADLPMFFTLKPRTVYFVSSLRAGNVNIGSLELKVDIEISKDVSGSEHIDTTS
ncbi:uncharacterized protein LOC114520623 [Dendronephthya gigantea]|uniref:uncharacterized protein LOC114520623 n=1 Tax=Dendronephthya gigantea TaxID=151771 RepID=UPI00106A56F1|nr:uncharacterized protein LOC114520623 [Dendronephthya gigantea]